MREILLDENVAEIHIPAVFGDIDAARAQVAQIMQYLQSVGAAVVCVELFGGQWLRGVFEPLGGGAPVNHILPIAESADFPSGAHITAVRGTSPIFSETRGVRTAKYSAGGIDYLRTFGVVPNPEISDGYAATMQSLEKLQSALSANGYEFTDIVRTWFYNRDLLDWYADFNRARTEFFGKVGVFEKLLPASTGIGASNPKGAMLECGALALKFAEVGGKTRYAREVPSPLQCEAGGYGSSFSRAVEIATPTSRRITVSGTASIEPAGATAFVGDIEKQVELTMRVIGEILRSRNMDFGQTVRSVVYCRKPEYYASFKKWCAANSVSLPHCPSNSIVCRDDLLFEVELDCAAGV